MATDVIMPKLGESITEGTILEWKKKVGESIERDETLLEISTDKVDSEVPSPESGKIIEILYNPNDTVAVGKVIARIGNENEISHKKDSSDSIEEDKKISEPSLPIEKSKQREDDKSNLPSKQHFKRFYSPLVRSIAKQNNVNLNDLNNLQGSGHNGRINKSDILNYIENEGMITAKSTETITTHIETKIEESSQVEPMGHIRKMISEHMIKSRDTSVHVYSTNEIDMTKIVKFRNSNKDRFKTKYNTSLTYTPFIIDAVIKAIHDFPLINSRIDGDNIKYNNNINIGMAVALENNNLIVPVIKRSEEYNFLGLTRIAADLAIRSRNNKLNPNEVKNSTFTVTNPGVFGSLFGMGIINQPNVALLSVGAIHKRPVVKETEYGDIIVPRSMMYLTLGYDHRIIDGAYGTKFLAKIKELLESFSNDDIKI